jgi:hypothetical protein
MVRVDTDTSRRFDGPAAQSILSPKNSEAGVRDSGLLALDAQMESILETVSCEELRWRLKS